MALGEDGCTTWGPQHSHTYLWSLLCSSFSCGLVQDVTQFVDLLGEEFKGHAGVAIFLTEISAWTVYKGTASFFTGDI